MTLRPPATSLAVSHLVCWRVMKRMSSRSLGEIGFNLARHNPQ
jgi:hypothetical protein